MNCAKLRDRLTHHDGSPLPEGAGRHLEDCAGCREFAERLRTARRMLREHRCAWLSTQLMQLIIAASISSLRTLMNGALKLVQRWSLR